MPGSIVCRVSTGWRQPHNQTSPYHATLTLHTAPFLQFGRGRACVAWSTLRPQSERLCTHETYDIYVTLPPNVGTPEIMGRLLVLSDDGHVRFTETAIAGVYFGRPCSIRFWRYPYVMPIPVPSKYRALYDTQPASWIIGTRGSCWRRI